MSDTLNTRPAFLHWQRKSALSVIMPFKSSNVTHLNLLMVIKNIQEYEVKQITQYKHNMNLNTISNLREIRIEKEHSI